DEADTLAPHPVEGLGHPARVELLRHAFWIRRTRIPCELGHPEANRSTALQVSRTDGRVEQRSHLPEVRQGDVIWKIRVVRWVARRVRIVTPYVEADLLVAHRCGLA